MGLYRVRFSIDGGVSGELSSNTIFGLICNAYKIFYGEDALESMLDDLVSNKDELVVSNPLNPDTLDLLSDYVDDYCVHNLIDRKTNTGAGVHVGNNKYIKDFDVLLHTTFDIEILNELFTYMKLLGIGANKSIGKGHIKEIRVVGKEIIKSDSKNVRLLSNTIPSKDMSTKGNFNFITRYGTTLTGEKQNPIIMIKANSELENTGKFIVGTVLKDKRTGTYINGKSICV